MALPVKRFAASLALILIAVLLVSTPASALSAELAKKCREMAIKAHPPTRTGAKTGTAKAQSDYYRACIANNGAAPDNNMQRFTAPTAK